MGPRKRTSCKIMAKNSGNGVRVPNIVEKGLDPLVVEKQGDDEDEPDWKRRFEIEEEQERKENELFEIDRVRRRNELNASFEKLYKLTDNRTPKVSPSENSDSSGLNTSFGSNSLIKSDEATLSNTSCVYEDVKIGLNLCFCNLLVLTVFF